MDKRSLWWTVFVVVALQAAQIAITVTSLHDARNSGWVGLVYFALIRIALYGGFLAWFVALVNEKRRWPLVVLIVSYALGIPMSIRWIIAAHGTGQFEYNDVAYPVIITWIALVASAFALCAFVWHYRLYKRTVWSRTPAPD